MPLEGVGVPGAASLKINYGPGKGKRVRTPHDQLAALKGAAKVKKLRSSETRSGA